MTRGRSNELPGSVVLLSGGMDSATCLALAARDRPPVHAVTVLYGQRHEREIASARALARRFGAAEHVVLRLPIGGLLPSALTRTEIPIPHRAAARGRIPATYVPARNTILLSIALGYAESHGLGAIYLGANAIDYSGYPDCRPEYLRAFERLAGLATRAAVERGERVRILAPLLRRSKADIVRLGEQLGVPWGLTWSCYEGGRTPCGRCASCRLRAKGFRDAGVVDAGVPTVSSRARLRPSGSPARRRRSSASRRAGSG